MRLEQPDDSLGARTLLILPATVVHKIDAYSPMLGSSPLGQARGPHDAMSRQPDFSPLQRSSDTEVGCRDGTWCSACGQSYPGREQLQRHIDFTAEEERREGTGYAPHVELSKEPFGDRDVRSELRARMQAIHMEVVCILEGVDAKTSSSVQVRHSYTAEDMVWDAEFEPCVYLDGNSDVTVDFAKFHDLTSGSSDAV